MGRGATATLERLAASLGGLNEVTPRFAAALDITKGGVLLAVPALMVSGLLRHTGEHFRLPKGFYGLKTIFLLLAFMALARLKSMEALRYYAPGEWGKLLGIDRAPEVRTLRVKLKHLAEQDHAFAWSAELCREWMMAAPDEAAVLYVDGHVRVYHGSTKQLPKHYVARQRLCLSATADYWVNAMDGKPFFVVSQPVDPGNETDDTDLFAIHRATVTGCALLEATRNEAWTTLQLVIRHRRDLVRKGSALNCQIREHLEATLPGFAACFDKLWESPIPWHLLRHFLRHSNSRLPV